MITFLLILSLPLIAVALRSSQTLVYTVSHFPYSSPLRGEVTRHGESYPYLSLTKQVSFPCRFRPGLPALLSSPVASSRTNPYSPMSGFQPGCLLRSSHEVWASPLSKGVARRPATLSGLDISYLYPLPILSRTAFPMPVPLVIPLYK